MLVPVQCHHCQTYYLIEDTFAGRRAKCRKCGKVMSIPVPAPDGTVASSLDDTDGMGTPAIDPGPWGAPAERVVGVVAPPQPAAPPRTPPPPLPSRPVPGGLPRPPHSRDPLIVASAHSHTAA